MMRSAAIAASAKTQAAARPDGTVLRVHAVSMRFGGILALDGVSFEVGRGEVVGLIGPNGSGKTTLFNCISNIYPCSGGDIHFEGRCLTGVRRHRLAELGLGRTFQNVALFDSMSVRSNMLVGAHHLGRSGFAANAFSTRAARGEEADAERRLSDLFDMLDLGGVADRVVADLPFGTRKRVELARALIGAPKLLLLDEPACGLNHSEVEELERLVRLVRDRFALSVLLVEHHMGLVMRVSDRVVALEFGRKIAEGTPAEVQREPEVIRAYLGAT